MAFEVTKHCIDLAHSADKAVVDAIGAASIADPPDRAKVIARMVHDADIAHYAKDIADIRMDRHYEINRAFSGGVHVSTRDIFAGDILAEHITVLGCEILREFLAGWVHFSNG